MRLGAFLPGDPTTAASEAEALASHSIDRVWFGEVPTVGWGDPFICMALCASASGVGLGTAVTPAGLRTLPTLATQLGTLNRLAPGRITVGYGSGALSRRVLGMPALPFDAFRAEAEALRALIDGRECSWEGAPLRMNENPRGSIDLQHKISLLIAAGGPRTGFLAGQLGDGLLATAEFDPPRLALLVASAHDGAEQHGRKDLPFRVCVESGPICLLRPDETLDSPRVVEMLQPVISAYFGYFAGTGVDADVLPAAARDQYVLFLRRLDDELGDDRSRRMFRIAANNYLGRRVEDDRYVTPAIVEELTLTGTPAQVSDRISDMAAAGVTEISVLRDFDSRWTDGDSIEDLDLLSALLN